MAWPPASGYSGASDMESSGIPGTECNDNGYLFENHVCMLPFNYTQVPIVNHDAVLLVVSVTCNRYKRAESLIIPCQLSLP